MANCLSYLTSQEALADYISIISEFRRNGGAESSPFIAFGGSYGGMLAAWMRLVYPSSVDGGAVIIDFAWRQSV
jgi:lysosomal Pro-X carboxypeptidase